MTFILYLVLLLFIIFVICTFQSVECFLFYHKDWKRWKYMQKHINDFEYLEKVKYSAGDAYIFKFTSNNYTLFPKNKYKFIIFPTSCGLISTNDIILTDYDKYNANKVRNLLINKINK